MKAPREDQLKLLQVQDHDRKIAQLKHQLRSLDEIANKQAAEERLRQVQAALLVAKSAVNDAKRALHKAEDDVEQVIARTVAQRERLDAGSYSPKELQAIQAELGQLSERQAELEDIALEKMEEAERSDQKQITLHHESKALQLDIERLEAEIAQASEKINQEKDLIQTERDAWRAQIDADLFYEYEQICQGTGGVGAVAIIGLRAEGMDLEFSVAEAARIKAAAPDDVLISEEFDYILVPVDE